MFRRRPQILSGLQRKSDGDALARADLSLGQEAPGLWRGSPVAGESQEGERHEPGGWEELARYAETLDDRPPRSMAKRGVILAPRQAPVHRPLG